MVKNYKKLEDKIISLFEIGIEFTWNEEDYRVLKSGKPKAQGSGEPKTDVYLLLENQTRNETQEIKISCKLKNSNEFQENKLKSDRAKQIFGKDWQQIITDSALSIRNRFEATEVYFPNGTARTKETQYTNGWKLEIASKSRTLSVPLLLTDKEIRDNIYKGITLDNKKRNSGVNGEIIEDSGVAEYMLVCEINDINSQAEVLNKIVLIDEYPIEEHYLIFTGNNFRVRQNKSDGNRSLAVQVLWSADVENNCLTRKLEFNYPLDDDYSGKKIAKRTQKEINKLDESFKKNIK